jgi:hypothetical protein
MAIDDGKGILGGLLFEKSKTSHLGLLGSHEEALINVSVKGSKPSQEEYSNSYNGEINFTSIQNRSFLFYFDLFDHQFSTRSEFSSVNQPTSGFNSETLLNNQFYSFVLVLSFLLFYLIKVWFGFAQQSIFLVLFMQRTFQVAVFFSIESFPRRSFEVFGHLPSVNLQKIVAIFSDAAPNFETEINLYDDGYSSKNLCSSFSTSINQESEILSVIGMLKSDAGLIEGSIFYEQVSSSSFFNKLSSSSSMEIPSCLMSPKSNVEPYIDQRQAHVGQEAPHSIPPGIG